MFKVTNKEIKEMGDIFAEMGYIPWPYAQSPEDWDKVENQCEACGHHAGNSKEEIDVIRNDIKYVIQKVRETLK